MVCCGFKKSYETETEIDIFISQSFCHSQISFLTVHGFFKYKSTLCLPLPQEVVVAFCSQDLTNATVIQAPIYSANVTLHTLANFSQLTVGRMGLILHLASIS